MGHPGKAGTTVGVEKHQVSSATAKKGSHPIPSHPIPSHPIPSYPAPHLIPPHPIPRFGHNEHAQRAHTTRRRDAQAASTGAQTVATVTCQVPRRAKCQGEPSAKAPGRRTHEESRTSTASTRSEHTQRDDETHRQIPRKHGRNDHVPSAKACQVPRRAKCQGARPVSHHDETQHASTSDGPTRATGAHDDSQRPGRTCQVPRRAEQQKAMQLAHIHVGNAMRLGDLRAMHGSDARRTGCEAVHLAREGVRMVARAVERGRGRRGEGGPPYFSSALRNNRDASSMLYMSMHMYIGYPFVRQAIPAPMSVWRLLNLFLRAACRSITVILQSVELSNLQWRVGAPVLHCAQYTLRPFITSRQAVEIETQSRCELLLCMHMHAARAASRGGYRP